MRDGHLQLHRESKYMQEEEERSKRGMMATWREKRAATESERADACRGEGGKSTKQHIIGRVAELLMR